MYGSMILEGNFLDYLVISATQVEEGLHGQQVVGARFRLLLVLLVFLLVASTFLLLLVCTKQTQKCSTI